MFTTHCGGVPVRLTCAHRLSNISIARNTSGRTCRGGVSYLPLDIHDFDDHTWLTVRINDRKRKLFGPVVNEDVFGRVLVQ